MNRAHLTNDEAGGLLPLYAVAVAILAALGVLAVDGSRLAYQSARLERAMSIVQRELRLEGPYSSRTADAFGDVALIRTERTLSSNGIQAVVAVERGSDAWIIRTSIPGSSAFLSQRSDVSAETRIPFG